MDALKKKKKYCPYISIFQKARNQKAINLQAIFENIIKTKKQFEILLV